MLTVAKQAKALGQKLKLQRGEDDDMEDNDRGRGEDVDERLWGANKRAYYATDTAEVRLGSGSIKARGWFGW